jgi:ankyrin repeat protein
VAGGDSESLNRAARLGDVGAIRSALAEGSGADPDALGQALLEAARAGHALAASYLLDQGADLVLDDGLSLPKEALVAAVQGGSLSVVELLLSRGAPVNQRQTGDGYDVRLSPALDMARSEEHWDIMRLLIARGALLGVEGHDPQGLMTHWSPLANAAHRGQGDACRLLIEAGVDPNADGGEALRRAAASGNFDSMHVLLELGANPALCVADERGQSSSAIGLAARNGYSAAALFLLEKASFAQNLMDEALWEGARAGSERLVRELLPRGANPNTPRLQMYHDRWLSAVGAAVNSNNLSILSLLLKGGADPNAPAVSLDERPASTPLHEALRQGEPDMAQLLLEAGADPTLLDEKALAGGFFQAGALIREAARQKREGSSHE